LHKAANLFSAFPKIFCCISGEVNRTECQHITAARKNNRYGIHLFNHTERTVDGNIASNYIASSKNPNKTGIL
jgi:hypothetical protein